MTTILAATYDTDSKAQHVLRALREAGVPEDAMSSFRNNPPGQHGSFAIGGDEHADPGAEGVGGRSAGGAAVGAGVGATIGGVAGGPLGAAAGGAVGALTGALAGAYTGLAREAGEHDPGRVERRPAGTIVAVRRQEGLDEERILGALRAEPPLTLEESEGELRGGKWVDFDPTAMPRLLQRSRSASNAA